MNKNQSAGSYLNVKGIIELHVVVMNVSRLCVQTVSMCVQHCYTSPA